MPQSTHAEPIERAGGQADAAAEEAAPIAAARHDRRAFAPLYCRYVDGVYRFCLRRLNLWEEAEDATSQDFPRTLGARDACRGDSV